jgi:Ca-activated chloride channel family protein
MTFEPIVPAAVLVAIALVLIGIRMVALYRLLLRVGIGDYLRVLLRWAGLTVAGFLLVLAATRPGLPTDDPQGRGHTRPASTSATANVFFVVDRSVDSRVEDYGDAKSRMSGIRSDISALIDQYPRARFALIGFAANANLDWPLSDDVWSLKPWINGLSTYTEAADDAMYAVNAGAANDLLRAKLSQATRQFRDSKNLVFYFGAGAGGSRAAQTAFDIPQGAIAGGAVLGYGAPTGGPVPQALVNGNLEYERDQQGIRAANSGLNEQALRGIAGELGVPYFHRDNSPVTAMVPEVDLTGPRSGDAQASASSNLGRTELYWFFTGLAAVLALAETYLTLREFRRNQPPRRVRP